VDEKNSPGFVKAMCNLFPQDKARIKDLFLPEEMHLRLSLSKDGSCVFLSEHGCALPRQARPHFCRIFPLWSVRGTLQCFQAEDCLAVREHSGNVMALMGAFDSSPAEVADRYKKLREDWGVDV
jgi:Fe-S-cluster containining protein